MRPVPIPDSLLREGQVRKVIGAPVGHEDNVAPVEVIAEADPTMGLVLSVRMVLEPEDVQRIALGERYVWLQVWGGQLQPFHLGLSEAPEEPHRCEPSPPPEAFRDAIYESALRIKSHRGLSEHDEALLIEFASMLVEENAHYCPDRMVRPVCSCGQTEPGARHWGTCPYRETP